MRRSTLWLSLAVTAATAATLVRGAVRWYRPEPAAEEPRSERRTGLDRRAGVERRGGGDRRGPQSPLVERVGAAGERRSGSDRRSGAERRSGADRRAPALTV